MRKTDVCSCPAAKDACTEHAIVANVFHNGTIDVVADVIPLQMASS